MDNHHVFEGSSFAKGQRLFVVLSKVVGSVHERSVGAGNGQRNADVHEEVKGRAEETFGAVRKVNSFRHREEGCGRESSVGKAERGWRK